ncbi:MAG: sulfate adenylyltransferase subunit CysN [Phycisphaerales bacterium]
MPRKQPPKPPAEAPSLQAFLERQRQIGLLRFITCGSVDDGKSTLIGRLLWESQMLFEDQVAALERDSRRHGTQGEGIDFALLVDGLAAEREQGITIDVAYRFFSTARRRFIVADTPGHEQYTRNMITGASTADAAILLVDARQGLLVQTRRHAFLVSLMGIRHVALAVNKMDLVGFDRGTHESIVRDFEAFARPLGFASITPLPISALRGDNVVARSSETRWHAGPTLMGWLETVELPRAREGRFVFPVQTVCRPDPSFRGFAGTIAEGWVQAGDTVRVTASGETARVQRIVTMDGDLPRAEAGRAVTLTLDREIDASRGDVISCSDAVETTDQFEATLVWMNQDPGHVGRAYQMQLATQSVTASITAIKHGVNVNTMAQEPRNALALNDIAVCTLATGQSVAFDAYAKSRALGSFILVDRITNATVAVGMIRHSLRRAQNVHRQALTVHRADRERLNGHLGRVIWFTGLSGSGKSTIANALEVALHAQGRRTYILDGDNVRQGLNRDLGFTDADRVENIRRVAEVAKLMCDAGLIVMTSFISPFRAERAMARELVGPERFTEVFVSTPLVDCERRDPKGLYRKARAGQLPNLSGIGSPYEAPATPEFTIDTTRTSVAEAVQVLLRSIDAADGGREQNRG